MGGADVAGGRASKSVSVYAANAGDTRKSAVWVLDLTASVGSNGGDRASEWSAVQDRWATGQVLRRYPVIRPLSLRALPFYVLLVATPPADAGEIHGLIEKGRTRQGQDAGSPRSPNSRVRDEMQLTPLHTAVSASKRGDREIPSRTGRGRECGGLQPVHPAPLRRRPADHQAPRRTNANLEAGSPDGTPLQHAAGRLVDDALRTTRRKGWAITEVLIEVGAKYDILSAACLGDLDRVKAVVKADPKEA